MDDSPGTDLGRIVGCYANRNKLPVPIKMETLFPLHAYISFPEILMHGDRLRKNSFKMAQSSPMKWDLATPAVRANL